MTGRSVYISLSMLHTAFMKVHVGFVSADPVIPAPATSAAAWTPLLNSHLESVKPIVDHCRGTLDTLLVFVCILYIGCHINFQ